MKNKLFKLYKMITSSVWNKQYGIKRGYIHRKGVPHFDDTKNKDEYQNEVYAFAKETFKEKKYKTVLDIGCGSGFKLEKYFGDENYTGVEVQRTLKFLRDKYPNSNWIEFEEIKKGESYDLVICSDVIEHIEDPSAFLHQISHRIEFKNIIFSTPERDLERGKFDFGPPRNIHHYREWNLKEFRIFLSPIFKVEKHFVIDGRNRTQLALCTKKDKY